MKWEEVCENPQLQNLPFKIELNKWGQIVMSPVRIKHSFYQGRIQRLLEWVRLGFAMSINTQGS